MGRKLRGAAFRAQNRGKDFAAAVIEHKAREAELAPVVEKSNDELFVIDTEGGSKTACPQQVKHNPTKRVAIMIEKTTKSSLPLLDQKKVEKLVEEHGARKLQNMLEESREKMRGDRRAVARHQRKNNPRKFDLWVEESKESKSISTKQSLKDASARIQPVLHIGGVKGSHVAVKAKPVFKKASNAVAVDVAKAGQSYRPDLKQYQDVVQDAVALELRRRKAQEYKVPLAAGMSLETRALLMGDSSSEAELEEDIVEEDINLLQKRRDKRPRAERNKQKRLRQEWAIEEKHRRNKRLLNSISEVPRFKKQIQRREKETFEMKTKREVYKKKKGTPGKNFLQRYAEKDPINVPTLPVGLETEFKDSSLRTIKPKGCLVIDRMASFVDRNLASKRIMGDKKRVVQGKRRKIKIKENQGHVITRA